MGAFDLFAYAVGKSHRRDVPVAFLAKTCARRSRLFPIRARPFPCDGKARARPAALR
jgi:hypothetical protein